MASLGGTYDASEGEQMSERSALPPGEYLAAVARSDVSDTKAGTGRKVELEFEVLDADPRRVKRLRLQRGDARITAVVPLALPAPTPPAGAPAP